jgi:hypothetical protein
MTNLSPQAQAVQDAVLALYADVVPREAAWAVDAEIIAAALRAAADQVVPEFTTPWNSAITPMISAPHIRAKFLAIADELEAQ